MLKNFFINNKKAISGVYLGTSLVTTYYLFKLNNRAKIENISMHELKTKQENVKKATIFDNSIALLERNEPNSYYRINIPNGEYFEKKFDNDIPVLYEETFKWSTYLGPMLSLGILGGMLWMMSRNSNGLKTMLDSNKSIEVLKDIKTGFNDVIGQKNAKRGVSEFVDILKNQQKYKDIGVKVPKGALLSGPPGTGKTLLAKAIAGESNLPFVEMSGSDFNAMFVGVGSAKIKNLYKAASNAAKENGGCIVFIDEIDAIGQKRSSLNTFGGNSERENTLNQLLTELDGFNENKNVMTFAATNRPELLDPALMRAGRFDRKILVDLPTINDRKDLFNYYLNKLNIDEKIVVDISEIASKSTPGMSGADISNIVNEAGIRAVRNDRSMINMDDINQSLDYVMMGDEKSSILREHEKKIIAYHEAGHAFLSYYLPLVENPIKVSIIPREKGMLGFSQSEVTEDNLVSKNKIIQYMKVLMAGRAAEEFFCMDITNGASNDIEKATNLAQQYVKNFGFSKENKFMNTNETDMYKNTISNYLKDNSDDEIMELLNSTYQETLELIINYADSIELISKKLLEKETIYYQDIRDIVD